MEIDDLQDFYNEAVKGIDENLLKHVDTWYNYVMNLPVHLQAVYTVVVFHMQVFNGGLINISAIVMAFLLMKQFQI